MAKHTPLRGRDEELRTLDRLLEAVRAGESKALVVRGEAGVGKTALLEYTFESESGFRVARAVGVESEMELAYAALHQLCAPMLDRVVRLPGPQRDALGVAFGLSAGDAPDRLSGRAGGDADVMRYEDVERPHPGAGRVLVQVAGTSFEPVRRRTPLRLRPGNVNSGRVRYWYGKVPLQGDFPGIPARI